MYKLAESKEDILAYFKNINAAYNDCGRYDTLAKMLSDFEEAVRAKVIDEFVKEINYFCSLEPMTRKVISQIAEQMKIDLIFGEEEHE